MKSFLLEVNSSALTQALKHLCRFEKTELQACLSYRDGALIVSLGRTHQEVAASGSSPGSISVLRNWAETFSIKPYTHAVTTLRVEDGGLWTREFRCDCQEGCIQEQDEEAINRQKNIDAAARILERHGVTYDDIIALLNAADPEKAKLWSPDDSLIVNDIGSAWARLFSYGIEPSDIRRLLHRKHRDLWKSHPKRP